MSTIQNFYDTLPKKRMAAGALFLNTDDEILVVKPTYRPDWLLPGGTIELDESPAQGCQREVTEELGLQIALQQLLCLDYFPKHDFKSEALQFVFYGGKLTDAQIQQIVLPIEELSEYRFVSLSEAQLLLHRNISKRLPYCLQAIEQQTTVYLESGQPFFGQN